MQYMHAPDQLYLRMLAADDLTSSREISPPRQRKPVAAVAGTERKFSWATQRITELTHDLDKATKKAKVRQRCNLLKQLWGLHESSTSHVSMLIQIWLLKAEACLPQGPGAACNQALSQAEYNCGQQVKQPMLSATSALPLPLLLLLLQELEKQLKAQQQAHEAELKPLQDMVSKLEHSNDMHQVGSSQQQKQKQHLMLYSAAAAAATL
jgi:hypothetical protein